MAAAGGCCRAERRLHFECLANLLVLIILTMVSLNDTCIQPTTLQKL